MDSHLLDAYLAPTLVPTITALNIVKLIKNREADLLYFTVGFGTILSALCGLLQFRLRTSIQSRRRLVLITALSRTIFSLLATIGFNFIRINYGGKPYILPENIRGQALSNGGEVFRYHFFADFVPGAILFSQTQLCSLIMDELLQKAKRTFTLGEASILAQLTSSAYSTLCFVFYTKVSFAGPFIVDLTTEIVLFTGFIIVTTVSLTYYYSIQGPATSRRYFMIVLSVFISYSTVRNLISVSSTLNPIMWFVDHVFSTHQKISLFSTWLATLTACVSFSSSWAKLAGQTNSLVRKVFHIAISSVFITGYNQDIGFTQFAAGEMMVVMILLETLRAAQLKYIGKPLENVCKSLRGKWDNKHLTLSHIYLHIGIFLPLWLLPKGASKLSLSAGLISVGVGDTAAAVVGTFFGKTSFSQASGKSLEGLIGNIIAMLIFKTYWIGSTSFNDEFAFIMVAIITAFAEAITKTCDNLILPLVTILLLDMFQI